MLVDIVAWEERLDLDLYSKQITNCVGVFDPVEPMKGLGPSRIRLGGREPIKLGLEPAGNLFVRGVVGPRRRPQTPMKGRVTRSQVCPMALQVSTRLDWGSMGSKCYR